MHVGSVVFSFANVDVSNNPAIERIQGTTLPWTIHTVHTQNLALRYCFVRINDWWKGSVSQPRVGLYSSPAPGNPSAGKNQETLRLPELIMSKHTRTHTQNQCFTKHHMFISLPVSQNDYMNMCPNM